MLGEFNNYFWPVLVASITIIGIIGCYVLLKLTGKKGPENDDNSTSGHVWDGDLEEENNPLPRWWVGLFVITIIWGLIYLALYPGLILTDGYLKWSQLGQYQDEVKDADKKFAAMYKDFGQMDLEQFINNRKAKKIGKKIFLNNCAQCHGSDARGTTSFPNLTDHDWLYGGKMIDIKSSITNGRNGVMPALASIGTKKDLWDIAHYVKSLSDSKHHPMKALRGKEKFGICASCHGADGKGNQSIGAPNLTDHIWLHGESFEGIVHRITYGINNEMPAWNDRLTPEQIHLVSLYTRMLSKDNH
ncbi:MAG: cytochrome-c oxidase, cbb3-type subunit III [Nitrosomonadales bacterium]|jgi:cytochrome c oxidase cbb3-type subunit 3|nr:cytochrome-c oxidase, cbb3-type subunit III [Nitrosomonadales bacterium]MBT4182862.1 cytochrome-c oxidase, cbb3-type subunit III [Nitrosomonadales bacterium]MBT4571421.1 cytochrome-c oxidase, cbb3-type subunit III [Nitrosomonadales bacterium]MBT4759598.1 cytochrome-c oxidase, cbb3-type subunit III [Nitrosomonadales bacterium]MBT5150306.1 cytochrome-c oxidase, cbb3-type subunit III [Nitrosomonadales bacterium]